MATWFTITYEGDPTEADFARVAELAAQGFTSGQLINDPEDYYEEGPATGAFTPADKAAVARLGYLRGQIRAQSISYGEIAELQSLSGYIEPGDTELAEWAGIPGFSQEDEEN